MATPIVPNVKNAAWHHPYKFSGRLPFRALLLMLGGGFLAALFAGATGYFGGPATRWLQIQVTHLSTAVAKWLAGWGGIGSGVAFVVIVLPTIMLAILYPFLIGSIAGSGVMAGAKAGKCRAPWVAGLLGFLSGGGAYAAFIGTALWMKAPLYESSRVLEMFDPPVRQGFMVIDALIVLYAATKAAGVAYENPFCEVSGEWFDPPKSVTIPLNGATPFIEALTSKSIVPLQGLSIGTTSPTRIQLDLSRCACGKSDYNLTTVLHWTETKKDNVEAKNKVWFNTTLPAALGAEIEGWSTTPPIPADAPPAQMSNDSLPHQEKQEKVSQPKTDQVAPGATPKSTGSAKQAASQIPATPTRQAPNMEICQRCGGSIDKSINTTFTCPYCGNTQWGTVIGSWVSALVFFAAAFLWGPHISASFWRAVVMWGGGILGGIMLVASIAWTIKGLRTPLKSLSEVTFTEANSSAPEIVAEQATMQTVELPVSTEPTVVEAVSLPTQEKPIEKPVEIDWFYISNLCRKENYEEVARLLYNFDKRSNQEYTCDKEAYDKTCKLIKEVGKQLDRKGGEDLMKEVLTRSGSLGSNTRFIEREWNGIGTWLG